MTSRGHEALKLLAELVARLDTDAGAGTRRVFETGLEKLYLLRARAIVLEAALEQAAPAAVPASADPDYCIPCGAIHPTAAVVESTGSRRGP